MKAQDVILQLTENLPKYSSLFSTSFKPTTVVVAGALVTVTKVAHGVVDQHIISVTDALLVNPITAIDDSGDTVRMTTTNDHGLTMSQEGLNPIYDPTPEKIALTSVADPSIDGNYDLVGVPDRETFEITAFAEPALTDVILKEVRDFSVNGLFEATYVSDDVFTYTLPQSIGTVTVDPTSMNIHSKNRISGAATIERAIENYEHQVAGALWAYVILDETVINKDRYVSSDADMEQGGTSEWNGLLLCPFSVYVFVPISEITGRLARDTSSFTVRPALYQSLLGVFFDTGFENVPDSGVSPRGDDIHEYKKAYYIHKFDFGQVAQISRGDTYETSRTGAWRDLKFDFINTVTDNGEIIVSTEVDLDDEST